jgi:hypothetical protein
MVNASLPCKPEPGQRPNGSVPAGTQREFELPNEPKSRRNRRQAAEHARRPTRSRLCVASVRADSTPCNPLLTEKTEGTQEPQESWRSPEDDASGEPGIETAGHYPSGPDFAQMWRRSRQNLDRR